MPRTVIRRDLDSFAYSNIAREAKLGQLFQQAGCTLAEMSREWVRRHIPVITLHTVTQKTWSILHSTRDNLSTIKFNDYYNSYRLIAAYLAYLDASLK